MSRRVLLQRALIVCSVSGAYGLGLSHAQDTGEPPPVRIQPAPLLDYLPALDTDRESVRIDIEWFCEVMTGPPPVIPADCREPLHGRTKSGGEGPENDNAEPQRGEL